MTAALAMTAGLSLALAACGPDSGTSAQPGATTVTVAPSSSTTSPSTPTSGPATSTPTSTASAPTAPTGGATSTPSSTKAPEKPKDDLLRPGAEGPEVLALQKRLSDLGYWLGTPDGEWGSLTTQAVYALQGAAGLSRDGVVGPATRKAIDRGAMPAVQTKGDAVEIDISAGTISFVKNGKPWRVLHTSTGNGGTYQSGDHLAVARTPRGTFSVQRRIDGVRVAPLGRLYRPVYFYGGYAVHGSGSIPAYPASHGCARVSNAAIDMVWRENLMPNGLRVLVHD
ncbi:MAG TPA: L,D-transpeptidase family protein [Actinomycetales bacterium]|nr:L,D-transpeptidase family protein [Actinomycetales bacterium]